MSPAGEAPGAAGAVDLRGALGSDPGPIADRLGDPDTDRVVAGERWLLFETEALTLRVRCHPADGDWRVASWTAEWRRPRAGLREATEPLGLWPAVAPAPGTATGPLLRRPLPDPESGALHSMTATVGPGGVSRVTAFDEPPDWR